MLHIIPLGRPPGTIPATIRSVRADYRMECGPCAEAGFAIRPDILYFE